MSCVADNGEYHKAQEDGLRHRAPQFTPGERLEPMIALSKRGGWLLLYLRWASRDENRRAGAGGGGTCLWPG